MRWLPVLLALAGIGVGCRFDSLGKSPDSLLPGVPDASPVVDAASGEAPADATCVEACVEDVLLDCPSATLIPCPLGCAPDEARCLELAPSHGADPALLVGVTTGLAIDRAATLDTATGEIMAEGVTLRAPGVNNVKGGLGYFHLSDAIGLLAVEGLTVEAGAGLRVFGARSLIILSRGDARIAGRIDVSAGVCADGASSPSCGGPGGGNGTGAKGPARGCSPGRDGLSNVFGPETGGGGGALGSAGASGGSSGDSDGGAGGEADVACADLAGGSGGGRGGGAALTAGGAGGGGGGAIQISSLSRIEIAGEGAGIVAAGGGGAGGRGGMGGGGGGSGGTIHLEAPELLLDGAVLAANGGGGGEGNGSGDGADGRFDELQAAGGAGSTEGAAGGAGGTREAAMPGTGGDGIDGTGGGGGGAGRVRILAGKLTRAAATISPAESVGTPGSR